MNPGLAGPSGERPIWEEPVRGFYTDPGQFVTLSGLDLLRSVLEGGLGPPIRYLFGLVPTSVEPGGVTFTMPVTDWLLFPQGVVSGATLGILVDAPLGCVGPDRLASCYSVHHGRDLVQVPAHRRAAERDADGQRPADPRRQDYRRVSGRGHRPGGPLARGHEHPVRDPAACRGAVGGYRAGAEEPAPSGGAGLAVAPSVRTAGGRRGAGAGDLGRHGRPRRVAVPHHG